MNAAFGERLVFHSHIAQMLQELDAAKRLKVRNWRGYYHRMALIESALQDIEVECKTLHSCYKARSLLVVEA
jgi:hypothetical protein